MQMWVLLKYVYTGNFFDALNNLIYWYDSMEMGGPGTHIKTVR